MTTRRPSGTRTGAGVFYRRFLFLLKARSMPVVRARACASPRRLRGAERIRDGTVSAGEDLGAAVPPRARGGRELDHPEGEARTSTGVDTDASAVRVPSFQGDVRVGPGDRHESDGHERVRVSVRRGVVAAPEDETGNANAKAKEKDETPSFDFASSLPASRRDGRRGGTRRRARGRREETPASGRFRSRPSAPPPPAEKKRIKKKPTRSPQEAAMRLLLGE